ncbi:hypothetical protein QBC39DRAFT_187021 [Podospora conica]|nr:hypothetical protein QBC39DRAFT_187021 [Schizothecium conicum]
MRSRPWSSNAADARQHIADDGRETSDDGRVCCWLTTSWRARGGWRLGAWPGILLGERGGGGWKVFQETGRRPELGAEMGCAVEVSRGWRLGAEESRGAGGRTRSPATSNRPWTGGRRILHFAGRGAGGKTPQATAATAAAPGPICQFQTSIGQDQQQQHPSTPPTMRTTASPGNPSILLSSFFFLPLNTAHRKRPSRSVGRTAITAAGQLSSLPRRQTDSTRQPAARTGADQQKRMPGSRLHWGNPSRGLPL